MEEKKGKGILKSSLVLIFRLVSGLYFTAYGFLRAINPVGGSMKVENYIDSTGLDFFIPVSLILCVIFAAVEFSIGINTLLGTNIKSNTIKTILLLLFLTPFTFYNAYFSPVEYNDSFGDMMWSEDRYDCWIQLLFLTFYITIFILRKHNLSLYTQRTEWMVSVYSMGFCTCLSAFCYLFLPIMDFGPYRTGTDIQKYISEKTTIGKQTMTDTTNFRIFGQERKVTANGQTTAAIQLWTPMDGVLTKLIIGRKGYCFLLIAEDLAKTSTDQRHKINDLCEYSRNQGYGFYCLTSTYVTGTLAEEYIVESGGAEYPLINCDEDILKVMVRSNPGLILLKDGVILKKWSNYDIPVFKGKLEDNKDIQTPVLSNKIQLLRTIFWFGAILIIILIIDWVLGLIKWLWNKIFKKKTEVTGQETSEKTKEIKK